MKLIQIIIFTLLYFSSQIYAQTLNFNYTGSSQTWTVPPCVTSINVVARGAKGGGNSGGNGAIVTATIAVTPGQVFQINVGGIGTCGTNSQGWNGGGSGQAANSAANASCGGGGATDIRVTPYGIANRLIVAAGGGGMGGGTEDAIGGSGGCPNGQAGTSPFGQGGAGATTTAAGNGGPPWISSGFFGVAGTSGFGGNGASDPCYNNSPGGGGGGGLFGGGGGGSDCFSSAPYGGGSGGGGSSLVPPGGTCATGATGNTTNGSLTITYTIGTGTATPTNTGPYCVGQTIQLNSPVASSYSWTGPNGFTSTIQTPTIPNATALDAGTYTLTTVQDGCTSTGTTTVVVNTLPSVNAGPDVSICQNGTISLTASGATTYSWSPSGQTTATISVSPAVTTTYTVSGTALGCVNTDEVVVTVNLLPNVSAGPDVSICTSGSTNLTASGATTYTWSLGGQSTAEITVSPVTTTTYTVTGTSLGCTSSDEVVVTVLTSAPIDAGSDVAICAGANTTITASGGVTYSWNNGLGSGNGFTVNPFSTTTYTVTGTDVNGCIGTDEVIITVNNLPVINAGSDQTVCDGSSITLNGSGANIYTWNLEVSNGIPFIQPIGSTIYTLTGTDDNGCVNTDEVTVTVIANPITSAGIYPAVCEDVPTIALSGTPSGGTFSGTGVSGNIFNTSSGTQIITYDYIDGNNCSGSATTTITVNPLPAVNAGSDVSICVGAEIPLSGTGAGTPTWSPSLGLSSTNSFTPLSSPSATTTYTLTVNQAGCISSDQMTVFVSSPSDLVLTSDLSLCPGECVDINVSGASYYLWNPSPDINDPTQPSFNVCPSTTTTYTVTGYVTGASAVINGDFSGGTVGFTSDYSLNADTQIEGTYFVTTNANLTHPGFTGVDHTTGTGNFLVVNGSSTPNSSVWCQTITVQPNTDYVFSTWVSTLAVGSPAILQFSINGSTLATPFTAPSVTGVWDEFYATWNSGANTTATICIVNQNTSLGGNDFGLDDIFFAALCSSTASVTVTVHPNASISGGADVTVCEGTTVTLNGLGGVSYLWNNGGTDGQPFTPSLGAMVFTVTGTDANGCVGTDDVTVTAVPVPNANLEADVQSGFPGLQVNFTNSSTAATNYSWVFGNSQYTTSTTLDGQSMTYNGSGTYVVQLIADNGYCTDTDTVHILIFPLPDPIVYIPNVFTPNADGSNDFWMIDTEYASSIQITILNRWGNVVAEIEELNGNWDGTSNGNEATDGVYFFKYVVVGINGTELTGHGNITLIR